MAFGLSAATIGAIAAPVVGGLMGSKKSGGQTSTTTNAPWAAQQPYLQFGFGQAQDAYNAAQNRGFYQGDRVADMNPFSASGYNMMGNFALGQGMDASNQQMAAGLNQLGYGDQYGQNAQSLLANYQAGDPTQYALGMANTFANSPYATGMVDAASRDVQRNLYENQLPGLALSAAGTGNTNSTRAGVAEGIMQRGAADRVADISSGIRGGLFNQGLSSGLNQFNTNFTNSLAGNNQLLAAGNLGNTVLNSGLGNMYNAGNNAVIAGQGFQNQAQNEINADMGAFNEQKMGQLDLLSKYMNLVNGGYGGQGTSTSPQTGGGLQGALGGAMSGIGMYDQLMGTNAKASPFMNQIGKLFS